MALVIAIMETQFSEAYPLWHRLILGTVAGVLFLLFVTIRQFVLNIVAVVNGVPLKRVTLFVFGGTPQIPSEANRPVLDLLLAVSALVSNLILIAIVYGSYLVLIRAGDVVTTALAQWLIFIYFLLTLFHFVPGFPLDGGRLLRALLWRTTGNYDRATIIASWLGWIFGILCILGGILLVVTTLQWFTGLVLAFAGWVLLIAAAQSRRQAVLYNSLRSTPASNIMNTECRMVTPELTIEQLVKECALGTAQRYFVIVEDGHLQGIVTMRNIKAVPRRRWDSTRLDEVMVPASKLQTAHSRQSAASLLEQMDNMEIDNMPVLEQDEVVGLVTRESLIRVARVRTELGL